MIQKRKVIIDVNIEFPENFTPEHMAMILRDYLHLCRFSASIADVSIYPINTRIIQQPLTLASNMSDTKN